MAGYEGITLTWRDGCDSDSVNTALAGFFQNNITVTLVLTDGTEIEGDMVSLDFDDNDQNIDVICLGPAREVGWRQANPPITIRVPFDRVERIEYH